MFKRSVSMIALLLVLWSAMATAADMCTALNGLARKPVNVAVDGFNYDFFSDLKNWISTPNCDGSKTSVDWTSDWIDNADIIYASNGAYGKGAKVQYQVKGTSDSDAFSVAASVTVQMTLTKGSSSNPATATFGFDVRNIKMDLAGRFAPIWQGSLKTTGTSGLGVYDDDLFDGAAAIVVDDCTSGSVPTASLLEQMDSIARRVAEVNQRFRYFDSVPTALSGDVSARLAFPPTSIIASLTNSDVHLNGTAGFVAHAHGECRGQDCGEDATRTLMQLAAADTVCESPSLVADSLYGSLHATVSLEGTNDVHIVGVRGAVQAVFACSQGYIGVTLDTTADPNSNVPNKFSFAHFTQDTRAAIAQAKAIPMEVRGRRFGYVTRDDTTVMTPLETDMFGCGRGGAYVDDVIITDSVTSEFQTSVAAILKLLNTKYAVVNDVFASMLSADSCADTVKRYFAQVAHPTSYGLWTFWAEQFNGFAVSRDVDNNQLILEINSKIHATYPYEESDPSTVSLNAAMAAAHGWVLKECGSACSSLSTTPVLNANAITASDVGIAISATINIPTASLSGNRDIANNARKQIKLIRRERAIEGPEDIHMEFIASVTASVSSQQGTLDQVEMMYSSVFEKSTVVKATLVSAASSVAGPVSVGISGQPFLNADLDEASLKSFATSFNSAVSSISEKEGSTLQSLVQLNDRANSETISQLFADLTKTLPTSGSMKVMDYFDKIRSFVEPQLKNAGVFPFLSLELSDSTVSVDLTFVSVRRINFEVSGVYWAKNIPVSRTELTLQLSTRVSFDAANSAATVNKFVIVGYSRAQGFSLPVRSGMRVGLATAGFAETVVNIPSYSYINITFNGKMERGSTFSGVFVGNMTVPDENTPVTDLFSFSMNEDNRGGYSQEADPSATLAAFGDHFMFPSYIADHQIRNAVSPLKDALSDIIDFQSSWRDHTAWVYHTEPFPYVFVASAKFPFEGFSETVDISVNDKTVFTGCEFNIPAASKIDDLVSSMSAAVSKCGDLSSLVRVDFTVGANDDYSIVFIPQYAASIYSFVVSAPRESQSLMKSQSWGSSRVTPDHLSWHDLYDGIYLAILKQSNGYTYSEPQLTTVSVADANLVDSSRRKFYPTELPTVFFPASWNVHNPPKKVDIDTDFDAENDTVNMDLPTESAYVKGDIAMSMAFGMSLWCSLGDGGLPFSTAFTSDDGNRYDQVKVPAAPDNTFTFVATVEKRTTADVTATPPLESFTQTITLTPGKLLLDALLEELPGQLTDLASHMITVEKYQDSAFPDYVQAHLELAPYQPDSDTLYVPLEFVINPTNLVAFGSSTSISQVKAMTSCALTKDYKLDINVDSAANVDGDSNSIGLGDNVDCTGSIGVAEVSSCNAQLLLNHAFSVSSKNSISLLGDLHNVIADAERFPDWYNNVATISSVLKVKNLTFNVRKNSMSNIEEETISLSKSASVPFNKLKDSLAGSFSAGISTETPTGRALKSLSTTNRKTFCSGLKQTLDKVNNYAKSDSMNQVLPFTDQMLGPIYKALINENVENSMNRVCDVTNLHVKTMKDFCTEMSWKFGFDVCGESSLSDEGLDLALDMTPRTHYAPAAFQFDTQRFTNKDISTGYGNTGDLVLEANTSANIGMKIVFMQRNSTENDEEEFYAETELDASKTTFSTKAGLDSSPIVKASLGSTIVTFDAKNVNVDVSIDGSINEFTNDVAVDLMGTASFDAQTENDDSTYTCHLSAEVPVIQHYFHRPANAWEDTVSFTDSCLHGSFVDAVADSFDAMTIAHFFEQDPSLFFKQFNGDLFQKLLGYMLDVVTDEAVAFLGKNIQAITSKALDGIVGPVVASTIGNEITQMVTNCIKSGQFPNATDLERVILQTFTGIMNEVFEDYLTQTINTPEPGGPNYTWQLRFGQTTTKDLKAVDWSCGDHGIASLEFKAMPQLIMQWSAKFDVTWSKERGIIIEWPESPAFQGKIELDGNDLELSGSLLFLAADVKGSAKASATLSSNPFQKDINFEVSASLDATGKLGLVAKIRQETAGEKANALGALPYVSAGIEASWAFKWGTSNPKPTTPASFKFTNPRLCLGSLIAEFMQQVSREVNRIIKPLDPIFGPDGILMAPIPGISKILGDHCNVLSILEWTCKLFSSSCNIDTVRKLIEIICQISADIKKIQDFLAIFSAPDACIDWGYVYKTFKVDWNKQNPEPEDPETNGIIPMDPQEDFDSSIPQSKRDELHEMINRWSPETAGVIRAGEKNVTYGDGGKVGFKLDIIDQFPLKLMTLLLGGNVPLFSVSFPEASMSYTWSMSIPIWPVPYVAVNIGFTASLTFHPPSIALMTDGIIDTVKTGNPSHLFRNLAVSTTEPFATGSLEVDGGAEGGISVVIAKVTVNFDIFVKFIIAASVPNFGGGDWVTFDQLLMQVHSHGLNGAIHFKLELRGGFKLYIQGCVSLIFWKKCWTVVEWDWDTTLWSWEPDTPLIDSVANDAGVVNTDTINFDYPSDEPSSVEVDDDGIVRLNRVGKPTYIITESAVMMMPPDINVGAASLTRNVAGNVPITFSSTTACSQEYNIVIDGYNIDRPAMTVPACVNLHLIVKQKAFGNPKQFNIDHSSVFATNHNPIQFSSLKTLELTEPVYGTDYVFTGSPGCDNTIVDTEFFANVNFTGSIRNYGSLITLTGQLRVINWMVDCDGVTIGSTYIKCPNYAFTVNFPEGVSVVKIVSGNNGPTATTNAEPLNLNIADSPSNRAVEIISKASVVNVNVQDMKQSKGFVSIVGNSNTNNNNFMHVDMDTPEDKDVTATAYSTHLSYDDEDKNDTHIVRHANVNSRSYTMKGAGGRTSTLRLMPPEGYERVVIDMQGTRDAVLRNLIDGCDRGSTVNVTMHEEGTQSVVFGTAGKLTGIHCDLVVGTDSMTNDQTAVREILINASMDERQLVYEFNDEYVMVSDSANTNDFFRVHTSGLSHVTVHFSELATSDLLFNKEKEDGTEYVFLFPDASMNAGFSTVRIPETHSPVILNGPVMNVVLGDDHGAVSPLSLIHGVVVAPSGSNVIMNSKYAARGTNVSIQENCVTEMNAGSVPKPSDWFISAMKDIGVEYKAGCHVLVPKASNTDAGFSTTIDISCGDDADSLYAVNPACDVVANMGGGDDVVNWMAPESSSRLFVQMGEGADTLNVQSAGAVSVDLGDDEMSDTVNVICKDVSPSILHASVFPIGVRSNARMEISHWDSADTFKATRYDHQAPPQHETAILAPDMDVKVIYEMNHNTDYHVKKCLSGTSFAFSSSCSGKSSHAVGANVEVALESYETMCAVAVDSTGSKDNSAQIGVDSMAQVCPSEMQLTSGVAKYGNMTMTLGDIDRFGVAIPSTYTTAGTLSISGSPAKKEIFTNVPAWTVDVASDVKDVAIMNVYGKTVVDDLSEKNGLMLISLGTSDKPAEVTMKSSSMTDMNMVRGCVESSKTRVLSDWILARAKDAGFTLAAQQNCSALFAGTRYLTLGGSGIKTFRASGLGWNTVRSLVLTDSIEKIALEEINTETESSVWTSFAVTDNELVVSKKSDDAFHVRIPNKKATVSVGSAVFDPSAVFTVDCSDESVHNVWNIALSGIVIKNTDSHSIFSDVNFSSNGKTCSGRISSNVCVGADNVPVVRLGKGLGGSILVATTSSENASIITRYVNYSQTENLNMLRMQKKETSESEAEIVWDPEIKSTLTVNLADRSENTIYSSKQATDKHALYLSASSHTALSFPSIGNNTISFDGVKPAHFNVASHSFDLLGGLNAASNSFCFNPCEMQSDATWNEIRIHDSPCSLETGASNICSSKAGIHVVQSNVSALLSVTLVKPSWDTSKRTQCAMAFNANGADQKATNVIPAAAEIVAGILTVFAAVATVLSASVLVSRIIVAVGKTEIPEANKWWVANMMRDFFNDQFSWASIVLTACVGGISDYDMSNWSGAVDGLVLEVKSLVFGWLNLCNSVYSAGLIVTWVAAIAALVLRILTAVGSAKEWTSGLRILDPIHAIVSSISLIVLPLAGYAVGAVMSLDTFAGVFTLILGLCIIGSIPVGKFTNMTVVRNIASYIAVGLPFFVSIAAGSGASRSVILSLVLICAIIMPVCNTFVLWKLFFTNGDSRTKEWKSSLFASFGLRAASLICGLIFISTLFFDLSVETSTLSYCFWFFWVFLPVLQLIPLVVNTKYSNIVPRWDAKSAYTSINGETTPLRQESDKDMSHVAAL